MKKIKPRRELRFPKNTPSKKRLEELNQRWRFLDGERTLRERGFFNPIQDPFPKDPAGTGDLFLNLAREDAIKSEKKIERDIQIIVKMMDEISQEIAELSRRTLPKTLRPRAKLCPPKRP